MKIVKDIPARTLKDIIHIVRANVVNGNKSYKGLSTKELILILELKTWNDSYHCIRERV